MSAVLPVLENCREQLQKIILSGSIVPDSSPPHVSRGLKMSSALATKMLFNPYAKILIHDLYLTANLLHPLVCDFSFVSDASKRSNYLERAKVYVRGELSRLRNDASADTEENPDKDDTPPSTAAEGAAKFSMTELYGKHRVSRRRALQRKMNWTPILPV